MTRPHHVEFKRKVRAEVFRRAAGRCEQCLAALKVGEGEVDHILPVGLGGEPSADNARLLCRSCHKDKTAADIGRICKANRQRDRHTGAVRPAGKIKSARFPSPPKSAERARRRRERAELAGRAARIHPAWAGIAARLQARDGRTHDDMPETTHG